MIAGWILMVLFSGEPPVFASLQMATESDCKFVRAQVDREFKPKKSACIELPQRPEPR